MNRLDMARLIRVTDFNEFELSDMFEGRYLELLINTKNKEVYHVHPPTGHSKAAAQYLEMKEKEINESNAGHLVSAIVEIEDKIVKGAIIGNSSLESGHKIHHTDEQLAKAKLIVERIMKLSEQLGEVNIAKDIRKHEFIVG